MHWLSDFRRTNNEVPYKMRQYMVHLIIVLMSISVPVKAATFMTGYTILDANTRESSFFDVKRHFYAEEKIPRIKQIQLRVFGSFTSRTYLKLSTKLDCTGTEETVLHIVAGSQNTVADALVSMPKPDPAHSYVYFCLRDAPSSTSVLQGKEIVNGKVHVHDWLLIKHLKSNVFLYSIKIVAIVVLLLLSALFSGLNLGLLSLDKTDLKVIVNTGSQRERSQALRIAPVRNHGNFLLCSLLFSNVLVNTALTLIMEDVVDGGVITILITTLVIVIFGEIVPQALCSRYGLAVGAYTIIITKLFMFISFPLSYPMGKLLDCVLGEEVGAVYTRDRLKELLKLTRNQHGLDTEEIEIIQGTLDMKTKTVKEVMTQLDDVFMISYNDKLNVALLTRIEESGYTRIPVYQNLRTSVVAILNVKNLTLIDPNQKTPVKDLIDLEKSHVFWVFENTRLDFMLKTFREGNKGHMALVQRINDDGPGDSVYETVGVVTLEDVLEELLQVEIYDENDVEKQQTRLDSAYPSQSTMNKP